MASRVLPHTEAMPLDLLVTITAVAVAVAVAVAIAALVFGQWTERKTSKSAHDHSAKWMPTKWEIITIGQLCS